MSTEEEGSRVAELESELEQVRAELEEALSRNKLARSSSHESLGRPKRRLRDLLRNAAVAGTFGAIIAAVPTSFVAYQSYLTKIQIDRQEADTLIVRRAQLLATIYEEDCEDVVVEAAAEPASEESEATVEGSAGEKASPATERVCRPRAHPRARQEAVFAFCEIEWSREEVPQLSSANLADLDLFSANLSPVNLRETDLSDADLGWAKLGGAVLSFADLSGANLGWAHLGGAHLFGANLSGATLIEANLIEANLIGATFAGVNLGGAHLFGVNLGGANLSLADLRGANLGLAELREADLIGADLSGANLSSVKNLTQEQINTARGDAETQLPPGLNLPAQWEAPTSDASAEHPPQSQSPESSSP